MNTTSQYWFSSKKPNKHKHRGALIETFWRRTRLTLAATAQPY